MTTKRIPKVPIEHIAKAMHAVPFKPFDPGAPLFEEREQIIGEYLARKARMKAEAPVREDGSKVISPKAVLAMSAREQAGMYLRVYGANALRAFQTILPRTQRRDFEKRNPGFTELLRKHCPEGTA
jgi:hypothetical protein